MKKRRNQKTGVERLVIRINGTTYDTSKSTLVYTEPDDNTHHYYKTKNGKYFETYQITSHSITVIEMSKTSFIYFTEKKPAEDARRKKEYEEMIDEEYILPF